MKLRTHFMLAGLIAATHACGDAGPDTGSIAGGWSNTGVTYLVMTIDVDADHRVSGTARVLTERMRTGTVGGTFDGDSIALTMFLTPIGFDGDEAWGFHAGRVTSHSMTGKLFGPNEAMPGGVREFTLTRK